MFTVNVNGQFWLGLIIFVLMLYYVIPLVIERRRFVRLVNKLPGEKALPIFGNALQIMYTPENRITAVIRQKIAYFPTASIMRLWMFYRPLIFILKAEAAEVILNNSRNIRKANSYNVLHPWLGQGQLTSDNPRWKIHRRLLTPSFHFRILEQFMPIFNEQSEILMNTFEKYKEKESFDVYQHITLCTLDIICEAAMGQKLHAQTSGPSKYAQSVESYKKMSIQMMLKPWLRIPWILKMTSLSKKMNECLKIMHGFTEEVIKERKQLYRLEKKDREGKGDHRAYYGQKTRLAFLDTLLEAMDKGEGQLSDEAIREEVDTFMFEGHDTTSTGITCALFILAWFPKAQDMIYEELERVLGLNKNITIEDLPKLKYLGAAIKESLRLIPSVPVFARQLVEDVNIDGYTVPRGAEVLISPFHIHRDYGVYSSPMEFMPERFLSETWQKRHPYAYIPFSAGPRNCIGQKFAQMEEMVVLAHILRKYKIWPSQILEDGALVGTLVVTPSNGLTMSLTRR